MLRLFDNEVAVARKLICHFGVYPILMSGYVPLWRQM